MFFWILIARCKFTLLCMKPEREMKANRGMSKKLLMMSTRRIELTRKLLDSCDDLRDP